MRYLADLPPIERRVVTAARSVAGSRGVVPFLVGGPVRDLELGRPVMDLDLAVESDAEAFARDLAHTLGGTVRSFPQFLTFKILGDELPETDVATARSESYDRPGALPRIAPATIEEDLSRRDFTVNAIALDILTDRLFDPVGGMADMSAGVIRVLHRRSFLDDPTRIYRGIRLATRLRFTVDAETAVLMDEALARGALQTVSRERLWREIFFAIREERPAEVLLALARRGALEPFLGAGTISLNERELRRLQTIAGAESSIDREVAFLSIVLKAAPDPITVMEGASLSKRRKAHVAEIIREMPSFADRLEQVSSDPGRLAILKEATAELTAAAAARSEEVDKLRTRFLPLEEVDIGVRGNDLGVPPGPHIAIALERTRHALFFGQITRDEAPAFARSVALQYLNEGQSETGIDENS